MTRLLVIDDQAGVAAVVQRIGAALGYTVTTATDPHEGLHLALAQRPDVIMLDVVMPDLDGIELLNALAAAGCRARILVMTGYSGKIRDYAGRLTGMAGLAPVTVLEKPVRLAALRQILGADIAVEEEKAL